MHDKTINLAPSEWGRLRPRSAWPSSAIVAVVVMALIVPTLGGSDDVAQASALTPVPGQPSEVLEPWAKVGTSNPAHASFGRVETWYPWHEILAHVARSLGPEDGLEFCTYSGTTQSFELSGHVQSIETLRGMIIDFANWGFLRNPDVFRTNSAASRTAFGVRLDVSPAVARERL